MHDWFAWLTRGRTLDLVLALALGTALATLAENAVDIPISALAQNVGRNPYAPDQTVLGLLDLFSSPYYLNVSLGETVIAYGPTLAALLTVGLLALACLLVVRRRERMLDACPYCASLVPRDSQHCAYCGSSLVPRHD
jgi:large-conductance mechanosensitive channel